jgi:hypothetical protein
MLLNTGFSLKTRRGRYKPWNPDEIQLILDSALSNDVHLLASFLEFGLLKICSRGKGRGKYFFGLHRQAKFIELGLVALSTLGAVVGYKKNSFSSGAQLVKNSRNSGDKGISFPYNAVTVKDKNVDCADQQLLCRNQL